MIGEIARETLASLSRVLVITHNTFIEAIRQKVLNLLLLFGLVAIASANLFSGFTFDEQIKFIKDFAFGAMTVFGTLIALMGAAQMIQAEIENRTITTLLAKPVRRAEFLWGKFFGLIEILCVALALMTAVTVIVLAVKETELVGQELASIPSGQTVDAGTVSRIAAIHAQIRDPQMVKALVLIAAKIFLIAGFATFVATFATSMIFTVSTSLLILLIGHLQSVARDVWLGMGNGTAVEKAFSAVVALLVPDFGSFGILDDILAGTHVPWSHVVQLSAYAAVYLLVILLVAQTFFDEREL